MDLRPHNGQRRLAGLGVIVEPEMNAGKQLRLAQERGYLVVIKYKNPQGRNAAQTAPVEIDEVEPPELNRPKVIYYTGKRDRKRAIEIDTILSIHPQVSDEEPEGA